MSHPSIHQKQHWILNHETQMAQKLCAQVLEKPKPPLWMILIPIFFIFFAQKMQQYRAGHENFVRNYLISRSRCLDAAVQSLESGSPIDVPAIVNMAADIPDTARPAYSAWITALADHFHTLLKANGPHYNALIRSAYASKTNYLLFCNQLGQLEHTFTLAVITKIDGEHEDVLAVIQSMRDSVMKLRRDLADSIFV